VIRAGIADTPETAKGTLAGPRHPALGNMVRALALYKYIKKHLRELVPKKTDAALLLTVPRRLQGDFWGHRGELACIYEKLGLGRAAVRWGDNQDFVLCRCLDETPHETCKKRSARFSGKKMQQEKERLVCPPALL
jgi:hypothetical protein